MCGMITFDKEISERINMLRFIMIAGVVLLHVPDYVPITQVHNDPFSLIKAYFQLAVFRGSVPVLTFISGYLLFKGGTDLNYLKLVRTKWKTLGVPFLAFNLGLLVIAYLTQRYAGITTSVDLLNASPQTWINAAFGFTGAPINYPLNFLRDLIVLILIVPFFAEMLAKVPLVGLVIVTWIFMSNLDGPLVLRSDMPVVFYVGGLMAINQWDMRKFDKFAIPCIGLFLILCASVVAFKVVNTNLLRFAAPALIWPAASMLSSSSLGKRIAKLSKYSLFIFLAHAPVLAVSRVAFKPLTPYVPYPVYWVATPILTILLLITLHKLLSRMAPKSFGYITGDPPRPGARIDVVIPAAPLPTIAVGSSSNT